MVKEGQKSGQIIANWLRTVDTIEFLGVWEKMNNNNFNVLEYEYIKNQAGSRRFTLSVKEWRAKTNAIGIIAKAGRYGSGTYAHHDIAFDFGAWISPTFRYLLIKEYQRLKLAEADQKNLEWNANRFLTKRNYKLQTEAIKNNLLPRYEREPDKEWITYAEEADLLNVALFGMTAKAWRIKNPEKAQKGENIRDHAANIQLIVLSNLEAINSELIREAISKEERFYRLQQAALFQLGIFYRDGKMLE